MVAVVATSGQAARKIAGAYKMSRWVPARAARPISTILRKLPRVVPERKKRLPIRAPDFKPSFRGRVCEGHASRNRL
jgi:hypothetical protein